MKPFRSFSLAAKIVPLAVALLCCHNIAAKNVEHLGASLFEPGSFKFKPFFAKNQRGLPNSDCTSKMCRELLDNIESAEKSIDFAIYGFRNQKGIQDALGRAQRRGVNIRGVVDSRNQHCGLKGKYLYEGTKELIMSLGGPNIVRCDNGIGHSYIMHNKFFIFDGEKVWTGSTNLSDKGVGGECHANSSLLLASKHIANIYLSRFEQLYAGQNHRRSVPSRHHPVQWADGSLVQVAFAPSDDPAGGLIAPALSSARNKIDVAMFFFTDPKLSEELGLAVSRGVKVRAILDPRGAASLGSQYEVLCLTGVEVKISNWRNKMHMKSAVIDPDLLGAGATIIGSQNWTESGNQYNDENVLYIRNDKLAKDSEREFERLWSDLSKVEICRELKSSEFEPIELRRSIRGLRPLAY